MSQTCDVCVEDLNTKTRTKVQCPQCEFMCCSKCTETYFASTGNAPQCMRCNSLWDIPFLHRTHTNASLERIRNLQKERLFKMEMAMLPETQEYAKLYQEVPILQAESVRLTKELRATGLREYPGSRRRQLAHRKMEQATLKFEREVCTERVHQIETVVSGYRDTLEIDRSQEASHPVAKTQYVKRCVDENCKGFVKRTTHACGMCEKKICNRCLDELSDEHVCKEEDVATAQLVLKDSKPCPECGIPIHKIDGCSHMFCTQCTTAFDWRTLEIHKNGNSNPHYYRWMLENGGRRDRDGERNGLYSIQDLRTSETFDSAPAEQKQRIFETLRFLEHLSGWHYDHVSDQQFARNNRRLRVQYLANEISDSKMKTMIYKRYKKNEHNFHHHQIDVMAGDARRDFIRRFTDAASQIEIDNVHDELTKFKQDVYARYRKLYAIFGLQGFIYFT